jgi:isopenicillin N synthase-like dioxygenase
MQPLTSHHLLPLFPDNINTAPLVSVKFADLEKGDRDASAAFFKACKELGFLYIIAEAEKLNEVQREFFKLPNKVKDVYGRPHLHPFYAYRYNELAIKDENGVPLRGESYNVSCPFCRELLQL